MSLQSNQSTLHQHPLSEVSEDNFPMFQPIWTHYFPIPMEHQSDGQELLGSKHFESLLDFPSVWKHLMEFYGVSRSIDLTYIYNRDHMPDILQHHRVMSCYDQWTEVLELNSSGLAFYLCHQEIPPRNMSVFLQKAMNQASHWIVYLIYKHFKPMMNVLYVDTCYTHHKPHELPDLYHQEWRSVVVLKDPWILLNHLSRQTLTLSQWGYLIPRFIHVISIDLWNELLERMHPFWKTLDIWQLLWDSRDGSVLLNEQAIMLTLKYLGGYVDFCIQLLHTIPNLQDFGQVLVNVSFEFAVDRRLQSFIHDSWPCILPNVPEWYQAVKRGDLHAIQIVKQMTSSDTFWNLDTLVYLTRSRHAQLKQVMNELLQFKPEILQLMCDVKFGQAIIFSKDDEFCFHILKTTNFACYEATDNNQRLLIQFKMIRSLLYLHMKNIQQLNSTSLETAVFEQFVDLITVMVNKKSPMVVFQEELWSTLLLRVLVTCIKEPKGQQIVTILLSTIPHDHIPSSTFSNHIQLIKQKM